MRHFSGELDGLRLLMADELDLIAGGDGEDTDDVTTLPPVIVTATPPPGYSGVGQYYFGNSWWGPYNNATFYSIPEDSTLGSAAAGNFAASRVSDDGTLTGIDASQLASVKDALKAQIAHNYDLVHALPDTYLYDINGQIMMGSEIKTLFDGQHWTLSNMTSLAQGYSGSNVFDGATGQFNVTINYASALGYMQNGADGIDYLIFHEMAHNTYQGVNTHASQYQAWWNRSGHDASFDDNDPEFRAQEQAANAQSLAFQTALGATTTYTPRYGW